MKYDGGALRKIMMLRRMEVSEQRMARQEELQQESSMMRLSIGAGA